MSILHLTGNVAAFCGHCKRDVIVREDALRCPYGDHDVEPTSLPKMPKALVAETVDVPAPASTTQSVSLPKIRQAAAWSKATTDLLAALEKEEAEAVAAFEAVRERAKTARRAAGAMRQILGLVRLDGEAGARSAPSRGGIGRPMEPGQWSRKHDRCTNCGTVEQKHKATGRCGPCYDHLQKYRAERPVSEAVS